MSTTPKTQQRLIAWLAIPAVIVVTMLLLHAEGRSWICSCGYIWFWASTVCSEHSSQHFLDPYSFTHVLHGFLYLWLLMLIAPRLAPVWKFWATLTLACLWELFENSEFVINRYRTETAVLGYHGDTVVNSLGDITCCALGFLIAWKIGFRRSIVIFAVVELALLLTIRDSLVLEMLMLVHPSPTVKAWQMCR